MDNIHLRGTSGKMAFTRSMADIMAQANLTSFPQAQEVGRNMQVKMKKKQGLGRQQGSAPRLEVQEFQIETSNRWSALQEN